MNYTCPHCGTLQVVTKACEETEDVALSVGKCAELAIERVHGVLGVSLMGIRCANSDCNKASVFMSLGTAYYNDGLKFDHESSFFNGRIYPSPSGQPFSNSVPARFLQDYQEAWAIINLSPKSSATLARRCLQGMIRDFCGIHERTLYHEIEKLEAQLAEDSLPKGVDAETIEAMRALKDVGNIGAHMTEVDGVIVDVEPGEAEALLGLIEMLFSDWYVARAKRQQRLAEIQAIAAAKKAPTALPNP